MTSKQRSQVEIDTINLCIEHLKELPAFEASESGAMFPYDPAHVAGCWVDYDDMIAALTALLPAPAVVEAADQDRTCPHCARRLKNRNGVYQHIKDAHGGKAKRAFAPEREESWAELTIQAEIDRASGIASDNDWLLP